MPPESLAVEQVDPEGGRRLVYYYLPTVSAAEDKRQRQATGGNLEKAERENEKYYASCLRTCVREKLQRTYYLASRVGFNTTLATRSVIGITERLLA